MSDRSHQSFTELLVWQKARELKKEVFRMVKYFPPEEKYRLSDQLIRSSRSVCSDIAEGHGRYTYKDQNHFCIQARGSLSETLNHLIDALDCEYIDKEKFFEMKGRVSEVERLLNGYISYLKGKINS